MPRGGPRQGSGRKKSALTHKTRKIAEAVIKDGLSPLEVLVKAMRHFDGKGEFKDAAEIAAKAAPYMHARLATIEHEHSGGITIQIGSEFDGV